MSDRDEEKVARGFCLAVDSKRMMMMVSKYHNKL